MATVTRTFELSEEAAAALAIRAKIAQQDPSEVVNDLLLSDTELDKSDFVAEQWADIPDGHCAGQCWRLCNYGKSRSRVRQISRQPVTIHWTTKALAGLENQLTYFASYSEASAEQLALRVEAAAQPLGIFPLSDKKLQTSRKYVVPRTDLILIYPVTQNSIEILARLDGRENW